MHYEPSWESLRNHRTPQWLQDSKFGIYAHWGIYSVPACGPNTTWYGYNMYREGTEQYDHHVRTYGRPSVFGYKDFIPMFTGEKFDAGQWAECFGRAGAKFAGPVAEHHDGFAMWDSALSPWNAARMGPKRNVVAELERAIRRQGLRFMAALHHAENWWYFPHRKGYDTLDPRYSGLYGQRRNDANESGLAAPVLERPTRAFLDRWKGKIIEVIDGFRPDLLWFDFGLGGIQEQYKKEFLAYYYNKGDEWATEVAVTHKYHDLPPGVAIVDLELGSMEELAYHDWITDTTIDDGEAWGYMHNARYKSAAHLVHYLVDNVSKNGYLLLNVGPKPNGEIPRPALEVLRGIGRWLEVNGEAIFATTPWLTFGEGPTRMKKSGAFSEREETHYTGRDIRFTCRGNTLYATCLGVPQGPVTVASLKSLYPAEIQSVVMLGCDRELTWSQTPDALVIRPPADAAWRPASGCEHACVFRITTKAPF